MPTVAFNGYIRPSVSSLPLSPISTGAPGVRDVIFVRWLGPSVVSAGAALGTPVDIFLRAGVGCARRAIRILIKTRFEVAANQENFGKV